MVSHRQRRFAWVWALAQHAVSMRRALRIAAMVGVAGFAAVGALAQGGRAGGPDT